MQINPSQKLIVELVLSRLDSLLPPTSTSLSLFELLNSHHSVICKHEQAWRFWKGYQKKASPL